MWWRGLAKWEPRVGKRCTGQTQRMVAGHGSTANLATRCDFDFRVEWISNPSRTSSDEDEFNRRCGRIENPSYTKQDPEIICRQF
jgi:hypothetical protein